MSRFSGRQPTRRLRGDVRGQLGAVDALHHNVSAVLQVDDVRHLDDVRVEAELAQHVYLIAQPNCGIECCTVQPGGELAQGVHLPHDEPLHVRARQVVPPLADHLDSELPLARLAHHTRKLPAPLAVPALGQLALRIERCRREPAPSGRTSTG